MDPYIEQLENEIAQLGERISEFVANRTLDAYSGREERALEAMRKHAPKATDAAQRVADRRAAAEGETRIDGDAICTVCGHFFRAHNGDQCFGNLGCYCSVFSAPAEGVTDGE